MGAKVRNWYKDGPYWRHPESSNAGDLIFNTMDKVIRDNDKSDWAIDALFACADLLISGLRWPDRLSRDDTAPTWIQWKLYKWGLGKTVYSRPQQVMTKDPYIAFYAACIHLGFSDVIQDVAMPWNTYSPSTNVWRKYLITHNAKYLKRYRFRQRFSSNEKAYVRRLDELRELAISSFTNTV